MQNKKFHHLYENHTGKLSDKWSLYLTEYDRLLEIYRDKPIRLLEIGIQNGGSLEIWSKYFDNALVFIGCDINPDCAQLSYEDTRITVIIGDANAPIVFEKIVQYSPKFEIIIDDGSHISSDIIKTFFLYFPHIVDGGIFIAEDLHCSYWSQFEGGLFNPYSSITFFKRLADIINHEHWGVSKAREEILRGIFKKYECEIDSEVLSQVHSVEFINSMCIIRKSKSNENRLGRRVIAGSVELVASGHTQLHNSPYQHSSIFDQSNNFWTKMDSPPDELFQDIEIKLNTVLTQSNEFKKIISDSNLNIKNLEKSIIETREVNSHINRIIAERDHAIQEIHNSTSWKLTKPVRGLKTIFLKNFKKNISLNSSFFTKKIKHLRIIYHLFPIASKYTGGLSGTIIKSWAIYKREGLNGIKHRIIYLYKKNDTNFNQPKFFNRNGDLIVSENNFSLSEEEILNIRNQIKKLTALPLISVLIPTYNPKPEWLEKAIVSVRGQIYSNWELCIADDASTNPEIRLILERHSQEESRIKVVFRKINGNISAASNSALEIASGDYLALLDHDDELTSDALYWNAKEICDYPNVEIIYSDEDKISPDGNRTDTFFKPDWSPELMFNCMYMGHLTVYKKSLISQVGGFRSKYDFSQDYDLALRATEVAVEIRHIPRILYHWRQAEGSAAQGGKPYARASNLAALQAALDRRGINAQVIELPTANRVKLKGWQPKVSIIIPTDSEENLSTCLDALVINTVYPSWEVVVVTNSALAKRFIGKYSQLQLEFCLYDKTYNFSDKCNVGALQASGEIIVFFNDDVRPLNSEWLEDLIELIAIPGVGAVSPKLIYEDHTIQHAGLVTGVRGLVGTAFHCSPENSTEYFCFAQSVRNVSALSGACFAMRKEVFIKINGFDAVNTPIMHSDVDLSFKVREVGLRCVYTPHATLLHIGHQSLSDFDKKQTKNHQDKADIFLLKRWGSYLSYDPYFTDNMRGLLYRDSPESYGMFGSNNTEFNKNTPEILIITHDMSASGAPMIAYQSAKHLLKGGAFPVVASPVDGPMREMFNTLGIPVIIDSLLLTRHDSVLKLVRNFDCVLANTVASWPIVYQFLEFSIPVMWYIHESHLVQELAAQNDLASHALRSAKHIYVGSERSADFCRPLNSKINIFTYGIPDMLKNNTGIINFKKEIIFSVFGAIEPRKGQDILLEAIHLLEDIYADTVIFNFVGRTLDKKWAKNIFENITQYKNVHLFNEVSHEEYQRLMNETDVIICPSRDDTLPLVSIDALSMGKMLICSTAVGTSKFINNGKNGIIFPNADSTALAAAITNAIKNHSLIKIMGIEARRTYLENFSEDVFSTKIQKIIREISIQSNLE